MHILRSVKVEDLDDLLELAQKFTLLSLPPSRNILTKIIQCSIDSFKIKNPTVDQFPQLNYLFVLEDTVSGKVIGTSSIHTQHGTEKSPHFYLKIDIEEKYSETIKKGYKYQTLKLGTETNGPTEIGGLILSPNFRGHPDKLGKQISFIRFLYMGLYKEKFKEIIHSELAPPLDEKGSNILWEALGRKFLHMDYQQADILSQENKEFILSLFPAQNIYTTLLPIEAQKAIGEVGPETKPVKKMLEKIGFKYTQEVDPFDGGPHYRCPLNQITLVKNMKKRYPKFVQSFPENVSETFNALIGHIQNEDHPFLSWQCQVGIEDGDNENFYVLSNHKLKKYEDQHIGKVAIIKI